MRAPGRASPQQPTVPLGPPRRLTLDEKFALCRSIGEECILDQDLRRLLEKKPNPVAYDGFEPSGRMHIAQGVLKALNVNKLTKSGVTFRFWHVPRLCWSGGGAGPARGGRRLRARIWEPSRCP